MTLHKPEVLEREEDIVGKVVLRCPYRKPFNSTLLIIKEAENDTEIETCEECGCKYIDGTTDHNSIFQTGY
ncbi:hypothetical protein, partial [Streptococcus suis]